MSQQLKLRFFGAAKTVTGSKVLLEYNSKKFLFDCGLFQGPKEIRERNWRETDELQACQGIIISHAHIDHSGFLPKMAKDGFRGPIYATHATYDLCKILLMDAAYLQEEDAKFANDTKYSSYDPALPLYETKDAASALALFRTVPFYDWVELTPGLSFRYFRAGHILGSAITQFSYHTKDKTKILTFTGDLGNGRSFIMEPPENILETDYLVMESTYGDRRQPRESPLEFLGTVIKKVISRGGTLIIPAFSVGRTQELLYMIRRLEQDKKIPISTVYLDSPMANSATDIYLKYPEELRSEIRDGLMQSILTCTRFEEVKSSDDSMLLCMNTDPKIVISAAGMLTGGRVLHHLKAKLPDEKSGVLFVGYQAQGTKGLLLKNGLIDIRIHHKKIAVEAEIFSIDSLSAHADYEDLTQFVSRMERKPSKVFLHHGEMNALEAMRYQLRMENKLDAEIVDEDQVYTLD